MSPALRIRLFVIPNDLLAAILAADVVGYSRLVGADEARTIARLKALRKELIEPLIAEYRGRTVKLVGDGALVEFASAVDAVECAVAIQKRVAEREAGEPDDRRLQFRIGINVGDIIVEDGDILGDGVNVAARLEGLAEPGGICVARNVHNQIKAKLALPFEVMGQHRVKNITEPVEVWRVALDEAAPKPRARARRFTPAAIAAAAAVMLLIAAGGAMLWLQLDDSATVAPPQATAAGASGGSEQTPLDKHRLAVLPFTSISADTKDDWFADGITEEMITRLSQIPELRVIARTSIIGYKGTSKGVAEIGRELSAGTILEGSVAESYDRPMRAIFVVQSDVAQKVAEALQITLLTDVKRRVDRPGTKDPVAFELYLKARRNFNQYTLQSVQQAITDYQAAIERDPSYADAYVGLGEAWTDGFWVLTTSGREALANAIAAADRALTLESEIAGAHAVLATAKMYAWDWQGAEAGFKRALELNPSSVYAS
jgi:adenylate cyclase